MLKSNRMQRFQRGGSLFRQMAVEEKYEMLHPVEHILKRPDMYVGSNNLKTQSWWLYDKPSNSMKQRKITFNPAFYKIFDEILVNAADNAVRDGSAQTYINVQVDDNTGSITIRNDGNGIPVEIHSKHNMWIPELIFGNLMTSSNYSDRDDLTVGGRYGLGAKLTNVLSNRFDVSTYDIVSKKRFQMTWSDNMRRKSNPQIYTEINSGQGHTEISFIPDFRFLHMEGGLQKDHIELMRRRTMDLAGSLGRGVSIIFNSEPLPANSLEEYSLLFPKVKAPLVIHRSAFWEIVAASVPSQCVTVSFVNALFTNQGGTHVEMVMNSLVNHIQKVFKKKTGYLVRKGLIASHVSLFINCRIKNPIFDSQTKKYLKSDPREYGSMPELESFCQDFVRKTNIFGLISEYTLQPKDKAPPNKTVRDESSMQLGSIEGFADAYEAGHAGSDCTLMLTEGLSAKAFAEVGRSILGRKNYGVYALRGKLMNIREQAPECVLANQTCQNLIRILGLRTTIKKSTYNRRLGLASDFDLTRMRYRRVLIIADPDNDGSHITGLICNFFHSLSPELLAKDEFINLLLTPLIKASIGGTPHHFFSEQEFHCFLKSTTERVEKVKYYKGLGTNSEIEAKECFENIQAKLIPLCHKGKDDDESLVGFFSRTSSSLLYKRQFIRSKPPDFQPCQGIPVPFSYFNSTRLAAYAHSTCMRTLPNAWDGLVPTQRKILWTLLQGNFQGYLKVSQLAGYVIERMNYNHSNVPLVEAIRRMAQDFVGSNNIPLLNADGQFGTRYDNGNDAAASRYIFTSLSEIARLIYLPEDDAHLHFKEIEAAKFEPENLFPVIPMSLVNGAKGVGVGFKCDVPNHSVHQLINALLLKLEGKDFRSSLTPFWNGYQGKVILRENGSYTVEGCYRLIECDTIHITEIPPDMSIRAYTDFLNDLVQQEVVKSFTEKHLRGCVNFILKVHPQVIAIMEKNEFTSTLLGLTVNITPSYTHTKHCEVVHYRNARHLLEDFYQNRIKFLHEKKEKRLRSINQEIDDLDEKIRFIKLVQQYKESLTKPSSLIKLIQSNSFRLQQTHLLRMPLTSFTRDGLIEIESTRNSLMEHRLRIMNTNLTDQWIESLKKLQAVLPVFQKIPPVECTSEPVHEWKLSKRAMDYMRDKLRNFKRTQRDQERKW